MEGCRKKAIQQRHCNLQERLFLGPKACKLLLFFVCLFFVIHFYMFVEHLIQEVQS